MSNPFRAWPRFSKLIVAREERVKTAAALASTIRDFGATTCCNHIVVDDMNISDRSVAFCIITAARRQHHPCLRLALLLAECSLTQRARVHSKSWYGI